MPPAKLNLEIIIKNKSCCTKCYKVRRKSLEKMASELKTLCGVKVGMIIFPSDGDSPNEHLIWPNNSDDINELIEKYNQESNEERAKRTMNIWDFIEDPKRMVEDDEVKKLKRKNDETYPIWDERYDNLSEKQLQEFGTVLSKKIQALKAMLKGHGKRLALMEESSNNRAISSHQNPIILPIHQQSQDLIISLNSTECPNHAIQLRQNPSMDMQQHSQNPIILPIHQKSQNLNLSKHSTEIPNLDIQLFQNPSSDMESKSQNPNLPSKQHGLMRRKSMPLEVQPISTLPPRGHENFAVNPNYCPWPSLMLMNNNNNYPLFRGAPINNFIDQPQNQPFFYNQMIGTIENPMGSNNFPAMPIIYYVPQSVQPPIQQYMHFYPMMPGSSPQVRILPTEEYYRMFSNFQTKEPGIVEPYCCFFRFGGI